MTTTAPAPPAKKRRGRETAADMVRSLGLVLLVVVPLWFLAQPGGDAEQRIRTVDQSGDVAAFTDAVPDAPVPGGLPSSWEPTVSQYTTQPVALRLGWITPSERYVEYAASTGPRAAFLEELVGRGVPQEGTVDVDGVRWDRYVEDDGSVSLVRQTGALTVVAGTYRTTAAEDEVRLLASRLR